MRWFCWHDWSKWQTYRWEGVARRFGGDASEISRTNQARICLKCGKEVHRRVWEADGATYAKNSNVSRACAIAEPLGEGVTSNPSPSNDSPIGSERK